MSIREATSDMIRERRRLTVHTARRLSLVLVITCLVGRSFGGERLLFSQVQQSIVVIETATSSGSGFITTIDEEQYIVTNEHVLRGGWPARFRTVDGQSLHVDQVLLADDRDIVCLRIHNRSLPVLAVIPPLTRASSSSQVLAQRMHSIVVPSVEFQEANIVDVLAFLRDVSAAGDPSGQGVRFSMDPSHTTRISSPKNVIIDQGSAVALISMRRGRITLKDLVDDLCSVANLTYRILNGGVVLSSRELPAMPLPVIGDPVYVFGNSDGAGAVTSCSGKIMGIGPDVLEVSNEFVKGNSGSPIVDCNGRVLAIASYATRNTDPADFMKKGTRFDEVRRFGLRLNDVRWVPMSLVDYFKRANALVDLNTFCEDLFALRHTDKYTTSDRMAFLYTAAEQRSRYKENIGLCNILVEAVTTWNSMIGNFVESIHASQYERSGSMSDAAQARMSRMQAGASRTAHLKSYQRIYGLVSDFVRRNEWKTSAFESEALFCLDVTRLIMSDE